ncbi:hypothetical protein Poly59_26230 [Rubripirellula reticaptiva]|uniref:Uncharacterized protein n=1 Tax=Rubripirellula reticaptiva TaxID=2528013 RepID=A0A5C6F9D9_9BACT|nr:hypothetical protein Poly59_26230 [Rubripirellula reticaptiva]
MIPAILSCVYVIYLYHTLHHMESSGVDSAAEVSVTPEAISDRIQKIQHRLDKLAEGT